MTDLIDQALSSKSWPFIEAQKILKRINGKVPEKGYVLFETGYGPSGLPHIGTFGEVVRTTFVKRAFEFIAPDIPTKLFCVSDDLDGLRKVPENLPNKDVIEANLGKPLTKIPDPFATHDSFGDHMNSRLCSFLDQFGFDYEFKSASKLYAQGVYDEKLLEVLKQYDKIMKVMLPTLGEERQKTYSPFMPISPTTGRVLQVSTLETNVDNGTIKFKDEDDEVKEIKVTGGNCKLQWKPDFGNRWAALDVDFEMYGKDHLANAKIYSAICNIVGGKAPEQYMFELFLDDKGEKISKSKGNGLSLEEWLKYAPEESLSYYMFQNPRKAKRLYFDVIPKAVDEYLSFLTKFHDQSDEEKFKNPVWHIHNGNVPKPESSVTFALLLNLASVCHAEDSQILWGFIEKYEEGVNKDNAPFLDKLVKYAVIYYQDFIKPNKKYRSPNDEERKALMSLVDKLQNKVFDQENPVQNAIFEVGREQEFDNMRDWFKALYEILLGQSQGPRFGSFVELYGVNETIKLIEKKLDEK